MPSTIILTDNIGRDLTPAQIIAVVDFINNSNDLNDIIKSIADNENT